MTEEINPKLPSWSGDWQGFRDYELKVGLEIDSTKQDVRILLGPKLAKNLVGKAWELVEEVDREKLRGEKGAEYLLEYLKQKRGKDKIDLMGDSLRDLFMKPDVHRKEGEEFVDYIPRYRNYVKAVDTALKELAPEKKMPEELYGWYLLNACMRLEPSDVANIKAKAANYTLTEVENTIKVMWSGGGLAQKDLDRKRFKSMGKGYLASEEDLGGQPIYEVNGGDEENAYDEEENTDEDQEQLEDLAIAMLETPDDDQLLTAYQDAKKKMQYKEARKMLAKTRVSRDYYPVPNRFNRKNNYKREDAKRGKSAEREFNGDCMRCGKFGHKAKHCPQKKTSEKSAKGANYMVIGEDHQQCGIYLNETKDDKVFRAILDSGASETIIGVDTLQELYEIYMEMGFDADAEIQIDRSLHKSFVYGNGETNEAIGLAKITVGLLGKEVQLEAHVVDGATPLLLSSKFMYEQDIQIDFKKGHAWFKHWGEKVKLERAPSYHLLLSILGFPGNEKDLEKLKIPEEEGLSAEWDVEGSGKRPDSR